jgi:ubiquinone/menaquinone biosynthesis C-methylase UbiE
MKFDDALSQRIDAIYATPDVAATRIAVLRSAQPRTGEVALDIGCGPGYLTRELALAVGPTGSVTGIDISTSMLELAAARCRGLGQVELTEAAAADLPAPDGGFDLVCALQVLAYVEDLDGVLAGISRVLRPGGRAVILDTDFEGVVWESRDRPRMERILDAYDAHCAWPDLPRILPRHLATAGLKLRACEAVPILTTAYHPNTYVHGLARIIHGFVTGRDQSMSEEADAWLAELDDLEAAGAFFFSVNRFVFVLEPR